MGKERNRAFEILKRTNNFQNLIDYKTFQFMVWKTVKNAKKEEVLKGYDEENEGNMDTQC